MLDSGTLALSYGWCWKRVPPLLRRAGHDVQVSILTAATQAGMRRSRRIAAQRLIA